jgi:hypothetical protein
MFVLCKPVLYSRVGPGLAHKHLTRLERLDKDKHSSLFRKSVNYDRKKFYSTGPRLERISKDKHSSLLRKSLNFGRKKFYSTGPRYKLHRYRHNFTQKPHGFKLIFSQKFLLNWSKIFATLFHSCKYFEELSSSLDRIILWVDIYEMY